MSTITNAARRDSILARCRRPDPVFVPDGDQLDADIRREREERLLARYGDMTDEIVTDKVLTVVRSEKPWKVVEILDGALAANHPGVLPNDSEAIPASERTPAEPLGLRGQDNDPITEDDAFVMAAIYVAVFAAVVAVVGIVFVGLDRLFN